MVNFNETGDEEKNPKEVTTANSANGLRSPESVNLLIEQEKSNGVHSQNKDRSPAATSKSLAATASDYQSCYQKLLKDNNSILSDDEGNVPKSAKMKDQQHNDIAYDYREGSHKDISKDVESSPVEERQLGVKRYLGIFLAVAAAFQFSLSAYVIKILKYQPFNLGVWRFSVMAMIPIPFLIHAVVWKKEKILKEVWPVNNTTVFLLVQAFVGSNSIIFVFFGLKYLNIADSIVIGTSAPIFVTFVAFLFLGERCGLIPVFTAILALIGVAIISKPPALTGAEDLSENSFIGVLSSFSSMILLTIHYVAIRYIRTLHHALVNLFFALWGLIECLVVAYAIGVLEVPKDMREVGLIILTAFLAFFAQTCVTLALKYEQAGPVALVRTSEVVFAFLWQALFLNVQPDMFSIIGAVLTLSGVVITSLRKMVMSLPEDHKCKKTFGFLLL
ncbi:unnamed protein product [Orchesella dallaii]|uniref:EamA domain-containing protein n=1 Tax=Orchesella dallaii TaxID=48710 RepID=A0ABP1QDX4_9HEXA